MAGLIYGLCAVTAFLCMVLLFQAYWQSRYKLLLWGAICFAGLTLNNILLILDKIYVPLMDLSMWRVSAAFISMLILLYGLIYETE